MPYVSSEVVKEKRKLIRKSFPDYKFSVTRRNHSSICVNILSGPIDLLKNADEYDKKGGYESINHFYIDEHNTDFPEKSKLLSEIRNIIGKEQRELVYDGDYGSVPTYYIKMAIGKWDRPYVLTSKK